MNRQIVFVKKNTAKLLDVEDAPIRENEVKVQTYVSTISCGTERANLTGDVNISTSRVVSTEAKFPRYAGYSSAGVVVEKGENVTSVEIGDRVVVYWGSHKKYNIVNEKNVVKIEDSSISFSDAAMAHIAAFPMAAIRKCRLELGESAMVMGLGILGQLAVSLLKCGGACPVVAADPNPERRQIALEAGADFALDPFDENFEAEVRRLTGGGVNVAIEVTGVGAGLDETLDCMAKFGRVALLGCTRNKDFSIDYYRKVHAPGISLIGAHTLARPELESSHGMYTNADDIRVFLKLTSIGRINAGSLVKEVHSPEDCQKVYERLANDKDFPVVVQFDWTKLN